MQTTVEERLFFKTRPALWPLYTALRDKLCLAHPDVRVRVSKTQISFYHRRLFAMVSLPRHRFSGISGEFLLVSFGLGSVKQDTRIAEIAQPYPGRGDPSCPGANAPRPGYVLAGLAGRSLSFFSGKIINFVMRIKRKSRGIILCFFIHLTLCFLSLRYHQYDGGTQRCEQHHAYPRRYVSIVAGFRRSLVRRLRRFCGLLS